MKITVYSTTTCPYCQQLKNYLDEKKVEYTEKLIDQDEKAREEMTQISEGYLGVPYTVVEKDDKKEKIVGFDKGKLNSILNLS